LGYGNETCRQIRAFVFGLYGIIYFVFNNGICFINKDLHMAHIELQNNYDIDKIQESDWVLSGNDDIMKEILKLDKAPDWEVVLSQYGRPEWISSCTKFAAMNALFSDMWYYATLSDIQEIEQASIKAGFIVGKWRWRGAGVDVARRWWNAKFPDREVASFTITLFSDEFWKYLETGRTIICSISVSYKYWLDMLQDYKLDRMDFTTGWWHATTFRYDGKVVRLLDSVTSGSVKSWIHTEITYTMTIEQLREKADRLKTLRYEAHIFIPKNIIPMIMSDVPEWQWYSDAVKFVKDKKIMVWNDDKFRPTDPITRAEVAKVMHNFYTQVIQLKSVEYNAALMAQVSTLVKMINDWKS